jgi:hypothetical protein
LVPPARDHRSRPGFLFPQLKVDLRAEQTCRRIDRRVRLLGLNKRTRDIFRFYSIASSARPSRRLR